MFRKEIKSAWLLAILIQLLFIFKFVSCCCETPNEWLSGNAEIQRGSRYVLANITQTSQILGNESGETWPSGIVKYKLHSSLTLEDTSEVLKAFDEYHKKTCIQFKPWQGGDTDFVSIEVDDNICGLANVCKIGGPQVAKFGKHCRNMKTMVHQLAHTLCLGHEHQRQDRDRYLNFSSCSPGLPKVESYGIRQGLYDYASQMHSQCNSCNEGGLPTMESVKICGPDVSPGLSVLDVDKINHLYNCQGCQRHRWVPVASLSHEHFSEMHTFGFEDDNSKPIFACRSYYQAEIVSGMYDHARKICKISLGTTPYEIQDLVEVLTIPGGVVGDDCSIYKLVNWENAMEQGNNLIYVGNILYQPYATWTSHIAYATVVSSKVVGKGWLQRGIQFNPDAEIFIRMGVSSSRPKEYQVLTCAFDTTCMLKQSSAYRKAYAQ